MQTVSNQQRDWVMRRNINMRSALYGALLIGLTAGLGACGGGGSGSPTSMSPTPMAGDMALTISDASSDDWATIGVKGAGNALVPPDGGTRGAGGAAADPGAHSELRRRRPARG